MTILKMSCPSIAAIALTVGALAVPAAAQKIGDPAEAKNLRLIGFNDLHARSAYQPTIHKQGERYIAYIGHHGGTQAIPKPVNRLNGQAEFNGTSIVDVTDPSKPRYLAHIPGEAGEDEAGAAQMTRVCDGRTLGKADPNRVYLLRTFGKSAHETYDVTDPSNPTLLARIDGLRDTHKNYWECDTGIAYLVSSIPGWRARITMVYDLSDPARPVKIRDFGLIGQEPGSTGAVPVHIHGMISAGPQLNRIYFGYGTNKGGILQIVDRERLLTGPKEPTPDNLRYPEVGRLEMSPIVGAHTTMPLGKIQIAEFAKDRDQGMREFVMIVDETFVLECQEPRQMVWFADTTIETKPMVVSNWTVTESSGNFCTRGGRFGAHSSNEDMSPVFYKKLAFITFFNAGVRVLDVRNPYQPREVGYFIPSITEATEKRCRKVDGQARCKTAIQTNNVETDDRGYIYIVDRANTGMHILELTGEARAVAGLP
jgi:hypothetical protein